MSGYGSVDDESEHALILAEDGIELARLMLPAGPTAVQCFECGEDIPEERRKAMPGTKYCVDCQSMYHDARPVIKRLDRIL